MCFVTYLSKPILDFIVVSEAFVHAQFRPKPIEWAREWAKRRQSMCLLFMVPVFRIKSNSMALWLDIMVAYRRFDQINLPSMVFQHCKRFSRATLYSFFLPACLLTPAQCTHAEKNRIFVHLIYRV